MGCSDYATFLENSIPSGGIFTGAEELKTEEQAALFGCEAGVAYNINYHRVSNDINNLNYEAYLLNTKSIAYTVAKYSMSWESLPEVNLEKRRWDGDKAQHFKRTGKHSHGGGIFIPGSRAFLLGACSLEARLPCQLHRPVRDSGVGPKY